MKKTLPVESLQSISCDVIGVGAIGYQVARGLAIMGVRNIRLIDPDTVETHNCAPQGYPPDAVGSFKVDVAYEEMAYLWSGPEEFPMDVVPRKWYKALGLKDYTFVCVDDIHAREVIFRYYQKTRIEGSHLYEARMSAEYYEVYAPREEHFEEYSHTFFPPKEAYKGTCTQQATFYCASLAASVAISNFSLDLRGVSSPYCTQHNIFASEVIIQQEPPSQDS